MICYPTALEHLNKLVATIPGIDVAVIMHEAIMQLKLLSSSLKWEYFLKIILDLSSKHPLEQVDGLRGSEWQCGALLPRDPICLQLKSILTKCYHLLAFVDLWKEAIFWWVFFFPFAPSLPLL